MKIIKINPSNPDSTIINKAVLVLKKGGVLMYPTDTCYGLGADISNLKSINKIYAIKKRANTKPISVIVPDVNYIAKLAIITKQQQAYIDKYFPGAVTLIFSTLNQNKFPFNTIGIRIPDYPITQQIANQFQGAFATTSANISAYPPAYNVNDFLNQLKINDLKPDLILDAGELENKGVSTVVDLTQNSPKIVRQGMVKISL